MIALFYAEEDWRGRRAWEACKAELEAKGEHFELASFVPPPVPDEQNFAMTPFLKPLLDYDKDPISGTYHIQRDTNGFYRAQMLGEWLSGNGADASPQWRTAKARDLTHWAKHFAEMSTLPVATFNGRTPICPKMPTATNDSAAVVLFVVNQKDAELAELKTALHRPGSRFNIHYEDNFSALLPHLSVLKSADQLFALRACAELSLGKNEDAASDTRSAIALAGTIKGEPTLISHLVRIAMLEQGLQPLWEGLAKHQWNDAQLRDFEAQLKTIDLLPEYAHGMRSERAFSIEGMEMMRRNSDMVSKLIGGLPEVSWLNWYRFAPGGWFDQNKAIYARLSQKTVLQMVDEQRHLVIPLVSGDTEAWLGGRVVNRNELHPETDFPRSLNSPYTVLVRLLFPAVTSVIVKTSATQTGVEEARAACALERYRLAKGEYPEKLEVLATNYIDQLPHDLVGGKPLHYQRTSDGQFLLYSIGWNEKDDGGMAGVSASNPSTFDLHTGDWVWRSAPQK